MMNDDELMARIIGDAVMAALLHTSPGPFDRPPRGRQHCSCDQHGHRCVLQGTLRWGRYSDQWRWTIDGWVQR